VYDILAIENARVQVFLQAEQAAVIAAAKF